MENKIEEGRENHKRIAKNTVFLYLRMLVSLFISFFTSRVILQSLGIIDFGIYNVVGGVVAMFSFFNSALSAATGRFLSYELGTGDSTKLKRTFVSAFSTHVLLGLLVFALIEIIGLWFVYNKLNIPFDRLYAAIIVFHISALSCFFAIIQVPFNACVTSHEKMSAFAYISILEAMLKLLIAYAIYIYAGDKLIFYAVLLLVTQVVINYIYIVYCTRNFSECIIRFQLDRETAIPMLKYSGWDLYGNLSVMVRGQGLNVLQNLFFGPVVNASTAVANQVMNGIMGFTNNFLTAVRPQIVKQYASKNYNSFQKLVIASSRYSYYLLLFSTLPILIEADYIMNIWLEDVPTYSVVFCQLSIVNNWISVLFRPIVISITATGNVKRISLINGSIYLLVLPISYFLLKLGYGPTTPFVLNIILLFIGHTVFSMITLKKVVSFFDVSLFYYNVMFKCIIITFFALSIPLLLHLYIQNDITRFLSVIFSSLLWSFFVIVIFGIDNNERLFLKEYILKRIFN